MRSKFEKLPSIEKALAEHQEVHYYEPDDVYRYVGFDAADTLAAVYIQGAWYAFQEQQKKIDAAMVVLNANHPHLDGNHQALVLMDDMAEVLK